MKLRLLLVALLAIWISNFAVAQSKSDALSSKVLALEKEWNAAYKRGDVTTMNALLADDFIITVEDGKTYSKSGYIALNGNSTVRVEISEMSDVKVRMHGNTVAVVTGAYHEKGLSKGKPYEYHDRFTDLWMDLNGKWQVIASHYAIPASE
jgi:ketosteroid isomerase-like protein